MVESVQKSVERTGGGVLLVNEREAFELAAREPGPGHDGRAALTVRTAAAPFAHHFIQAGFCMSQPSAADEQGERDHGCPYFEVTIATSNKALLHGGRGRGGGNEPQIRVGLVRVCRGGAAKQSESVRRAEDHCRQSPQELHPLSALNIDDEENIRIAMEPLGDFAGSAAYCSNGMFRTGKMDGADKRAMAWVRPFEHDKGGDLFVPSKWGAGAHKAEAEAELEAAGVIKGERPSAEAEQVEGISEVQEFEEHEDKPHVVTIGCGVNVAGNEIFFTRNGRYVGTAHYRVRADIPIWKVEFRPTISLQGNCVGTRLSLSWADRLQNREIRSDVALAGGGRGHAPPIRIGNIPYQSYFCGVVRHLQHQCQATEVDADARDVHVALEEYALAQVQRNALALRVGELVDVSVVRPLHAGSLLSAQVDTTCIKGIVCQVPPPGGAGTFLTDCLCQSYVVAVSQKDYERENDSIAGVVHGAVEAVKKTVMDVEEGATDVLGESHEDHDGVQERRASFLQRQLTGFVHDMLDESMNSNIKSIMFLEVTHADEAKKLAATHHGAQWAIIGRSDHSDQQHRGKPLSRRFLHLLTNLPRFWINPISASLGVAFACESVIDKVPLSKPQVNKLKAMGTMCTEMARHIVSLFDEFLTAFREGNARAYIADTWNRVDALLHIVFVSFVVLRVCSVYDVSVADADPDRLTFVAYRVLSINCIVLWIRLTSLLSVSSSLGPFIRMMFMMYEDMAKFFVILFMYIFGFAGTFFVWFHDIKSSDDISTAAVSATNTTSTARRLLGGGGRDSAAADSSDGPYSNYAKTILELFKASLGDFSYDELWAIPSWGTQYFGIALLTLFLFIGAVMLLNLLIAILADTYTKVQEVASSTFHFERTKIVQEHMIYWQGHATVIKLPPPLNSFTFLVGYPLNFLRGTVHQLCSLCKSRKSRIQDESMEAVERLGAWDSQRFISFFNATVMMGWAFIFGLVLLMLHTAVCFVLCAPVFIFNAVWVSVLMCHVYVQEPGHVKGRFSSRHDVSSSELVFEIPGITALAKPIRYVVALVLFPFILVLALAPPLVYMVFNLAFYFLTFPFQFAADVWIKSWFKLFDRNHLAIWHEHVDDVPPEKVLTSLRAAVFAVVAHNRFAKSKAPQNLYARELSGNLFTAVQTKWVGRTAEREAIWLPLALKWRRRKHELKNSDTDTSNANEDADHNLHQHVHIARHTHSFITEELAAAVAQTAWSSKDEGGAKPPTIFRLDDFMVPLKGDHEGDYILLAEQLVFCELLARK
eukprot:g310.t1